VKNSEPVMEILFKRFADSSESMLQREIRDHCLGG
jgi:hypothetical protein